MCVCTIYKMVSSSVSSSWLKQLTPRQMISVASRARGQYLRARASHRQASRHRLEDALPRRLKAPKGRAKSAPWGKWQPVRLPGWHHAFLVRQKGSKEQIVVAQKRAGGGGGGGKRPRPYPHSPDDVLLLSPKTPPLSKNKSSGGVKKPVVVVVAAAAALNAFSPRRTTPKHQRRHKSRRARTT